MKKALNKCRPILPASNTNTSLITPGIPKACTWCRSLLMRVLLPGRCLRTGPGVLPPNDPPSPSRLCRDRVRRLPLKGRIFFYSFGDISEEFLKLSRIYSKTCCVLSNTFLFSILMTFIPCCSKNFSRSKSFSIPSGVK